MDPVVQTSVPDAGRHPYRDWIDRLVALQREGAGLAVGPAPAAPTVPREGPVVLILAPHPDDEVIVGGLPLRLLRECGCRVVDLAVTLGSRAERRQARWLEATHACAALGFELATPDPAGLEGISPGGRAADPARWRRAVQATAAVIDQHHPAIVLLPHEADWNQTHLGTHALALEALREVAGLRCRVVETEFWHAMQAPNLMVESSAADVADLVAALALHVGEVARNPYHLRLPAWMMDNVRRGAELVGGQGGTAPDFTFATLYRLREWRDGALHDALPTGRAIAVDQPLAAVFGL